MFELFIISAVQYLTPCGKVNYLLEAKLIENPGIDAMPILLPNLHTEIKTGYEILQPFLNKQGRELDKVIGDGICLFRALSRNITGVEDHHLLLRKAISDFEENNPVLFTGLSSAIIQVPLQEHLKRIKKPYVWGTTLEIIAAASLLHFT